jgi:hypothetical protein
MDRGEERRKVQRMVSDVGADVQAGAAANVSLSGVRKSNRMSSSSFS